VSRGREREKRRRALRTHPAYPVRHAEGCPRRKTLPEDDLFAKMEPEAYVCTCGVAERRKALKAEIERANIDTVNAILKRSLKEGRAIPVCDARGDLSSYLLVPRREDD